MNPCSFCLQYIEGGWMTPVSLLRLFRVEEVRNTFLDPFFQCTSLREDTGIKHVFRTQENRSTKNCFWKYFDFKKYSTRPDFLPLIIVWLNASGLVGLFCLVARGAGSGGPVYYLAMLEDLLQLGSSCRTLLEFGQSRVTCLPRCLPMLWDSANSHFTVRM